MDATRVRLVRIDEAMLLAAEAGRLEHHAGGKVGPVAGLVHETLTQARTFLAACPGGAAWLGVDDGAGQIVGTCAFKSGVKPDTGEIEIAYHTYAPFEGRGYARAMAKGLVALAADLAGLRRVIAHTLPERNASCRVLEASGFTFAGEGIDPEDGRVWRWVREAGVIGSPSPRG
jgi:[ribosomal protein S5]-alanine N-acetyltransferase